MDTEQLSEHERLCTQLCTHPAERTIRFQGNLKENLLMPLLKHRLFFQEKCLDDLMLNANTMLSLGHKLF